MKGSLLKNVRKTNFDMKSVDILSIFCTSLVNTFEFDAYIIIYVILEKLAAGETFEQVLEAHPRLTRDAIYAALDFGNTTSVVE